MEAKFNDTSFAMRKFLIQFRFRNSTQHIECVDLISGICRVGTNFCGICTAVFFETQKKLTIEKYAP